MGMKTKTGRVDKLEGPAVEAIHRKVTELELEVGALNDTIKRQLATEEQLKARIAELESLAKPTIL